MTVAKAPRTPAIFTSLCLSSAALLASACGEEEKKEEPKPDKPELPKRPDEAELAPEKVLDLSGPKAPEASTVFFAVDGALVPLACFDKDVGKLKGGTDCGKMVADGESVYVESEFTKALDVIGGPHNALCEVDDSPTSRSATSVAGGAAYDFAVWPKSAATLVRRAPADSLSERATQLASGEQEALVAAISKVKSSASKGELRLKQKVELDIDGDGKAEIFFSAVMAHPSSADRNLFTGVLMAPGGDLGALRLVEESKRDTDVVVLNGVVDLDGDGKHELWTGLSYDGGSGDRVVKIDGDKVEALSKWSCGA